MAKPREGRHADKPGHCELHGKRIAVIGGLDGQGRRQTDAGIALCYDCGKPLNTRVFSVTINSYENDHYVSRRVGDLKAHEIDQR